MNDKPLQSYSIDVISKMLDLTPRRIRQLTDDGVIFKISQGRYDLVRSVRGYINFLRERAAKAQSDTGTALGRKRGLEADKAEIELETLRGQRVIVADVDEMLQRVAGVVRTNVLGVAAKVSPRIQAKMTIAEVEAVIIDGINDALSALSTLAVKRE